MRTWLQVMVTSMLLTGCATAAPPPLATINYRPDGKLAILPVTIMGRKEWFYWDTGAPRLVLDPRLAAALNLTTRQPGSTTGVGKGAVNIAQVDPVEVGLGGIRYIADDPWIIDLSGTPGPKDVRGLVGADLWTRYVVRMNSQAHRLELFTPGTYRPRSDEVVLPLIVEKQKLFVEVRLDVKAGLSVVHRLRVDTGSGDSVNDPIVGQAVETRRTQVGNGLGTPYEAVSGKVDAIHLGPFTIRNVWGPGGTGPAIGMEVLRRFVVTFDAPGGKLYLKPTRALAEPVPAPG
ncbi:MAG: aspartyl protease family protein [Sphingomicrobium sp.]|nr:aspartyl protease family protein [Sphingomonadales bacterium]